MPITITQENPKGADAVALITELDAYLAPLYPPESQHGNSPQQLSAANVAFFILRVKQVPAACGAIKIGNGSGEIKRVYVRPQYRGREFAKMMITHLEKYGAQQGIKLIQLESGVYQLEALGLYERLGYRRRNAFPPYDEDPLSVYYEKSL